MATTTAEKNLEGKDLSFAQKKELLKECLRREYSSLFDPFEKEFYSPEVSFADPMTSFTGMDKYQANVDMLAGRTPLGNFLFEDAGIIMFSAEDMGERGIRTRWMLRLCAKILPGKPVARFTGVSEYKLDADCKVIAQQDYWDSINLKNGKYEAVSVLEGVQDFVGQLFQTKKAQLSMNSELPYILLRRGKYYSVRKYPKRNVVQCTYQTRPEAYDTLGRYQRDSQRDPMVPALLRIPKNGMGEKTMTWPMTFQYPGEDKVDAIPKPRSDEVVTLEEDGMVVAVIEFPEEATPRNVEDNATFLERVVEKDGLVVKEESKFMYTVAQYNALFSLAQKRNEVWVELEKHDW